LSVVVPVHNGETTLDEQLAAVTTSADASMEILVVDNRSTDGTRSIIERWVERDPRVRLVVADERAGEPHARNVGIAAARSDAIAFCDADDVVASTWAGAIAEALQTAGFVTGPVDVDRLNPSWLAEVRGRTIFEEMPRTVGGIPFAHGCNIGVTKKAAAVVGGFDEGVRIGADIDFAIRLHRAGIELQWAPDAVVHYRHRAGSKERWRQAYAYGRASARFHEEAGSPWSLRHRARAQARRLGWLVKSVPRLGNRSIRTRWCWTAALASGEIRGAE
jgi:glycosyltransferase involved in cell wall biosynthesis